MEFFRLKNVLGQDPQAEVEPLVDITTGKTQEIQITTLSEDRDAGIVQTGDDLYYVTDVAAPAVSEGQRLILVEACTDSRATDLIDQQTKDSVLGPDRAYFVEWKLQVVGEDDRWKVGDITSGRVTLCGPA